MAALFHVSGWQDLSELSVGESFILNPGRQCAEGLGVYFAEGSARVRAVKAILLPS
jgi:hypothetical protein